MLDGMRRNASSWIIKVLFAVIIIVFIFAFGMGGFQGDRAQVLAYVNDQAIMIQDFERIYERRVRAMRDQNPNVSFEDLAKAQFKRQVFDTMVNTNLLLAEAQRLGLAVSEAELIGYIRDVPVFQNEQNQFDKARYETVLSGQRMSPGDYEGEVARSILLDKLRRSLDLAVATSGTEARDLFTYAKEQMVVDYVLYAWKDFASAVKPSDEEVAAWFESNKERFRLPAMAEFTLLPVTPVTLAKPAEITDDEAAAYYQANTAEFKQPAQAKARHILIKVDETAGADEVDKTRREILDVRSRVLKGESFADLAREYSQGPSSVKGGDLGWFPKGAMVGPFDETAFSLPLNKVSAPVRTRFGWHLILVEDRKPGGLQSLEEATTDIKRILAEERAASRLQDSLDQALEQAATGDTMQRIGTDIGVEPTMTGLVSRDQLASRLGLEEDIAGRLFDLTLGQATDAPIAIADGYMLAAKTEVNPSEVPPLEDVRPQVVENLVREQAMDLAKEKARSVLESLREPATAVSASKALSGQLETSQPIGRRGFIPGLGMNPTLVESAFAEPLGQWLEDAYPVSDGYVLARPTKRLEPKESEWEAEKEFWIMNLRRSQEDAMFKAYLAELRDKAEFRLVTPQVLEQ